MVTLAEQEAKLRTTNPSNSMLNTWYNLILKNNLVFVQVDTREQQPITEDELGLPTQRATLQTGDYMVKVKNHTIRLLFERKSVQDLYGTLFYGRDQFYNEIERFQVSKEFDSFLIVVEGSLDDFLKYVPPRKACKFCTYFTKNPGEANYIGVCNCPGHENIARINDQCKEFIDKELWEDRIVSMLNSKKATINSLNCRPGIKVIFCGSRPEMVEMFEDMIKQYCLQNFEMIINAKN